MAIVSGRHPVVEHLLDLLGLKGQHVRRLVLTLQVDSAPTLEVEVERFATVHDFEALANLATAIPPRNITIREVPPNG